MRLSFIPACRGHLLQQQRDRTATRKPTTETGKSGTVSRFVEASGQEFRPVRPPWPKMGGRTRKRAKDWLWGCGRRAFVGRHVCKWPLRAVQGRWKPLAVSNAMSWSSFAKRTLCLQAPKRDMCLVARRPSNMSRYYACLPWGALQSSFCAICWLPLACEENKRRTRAASTQPCSTGWDSRMPVCPRQANVCHCAQLSPPLALCGRMGNAVRRKKIPWRGSKARRDGSQAKDVRSELSVCARLRPVSHQGRAQGCPRPGQRDKRRAEGSLGTRHAKCLSALSKRRTRALVKPTGSPHYPPWFPVSVFFWVCSSFKSPQQPLFF